MGREGQQEALTGYDRVPYPGHPFAQTHPDRLATVATLFGLRPAPPDACRVLELGCGDGGNLVPMAYGLPGTTFSGIDLAGRAIERARRLASALGLDNVRFEHADLTAARGEFDYVIAHGVYSWIEPTARDALLAACRRHLAPGGVAYISYDVLPGGHLREITRQMLRWHLRDVDEPEQRIAQARALLGAIVEQSGEMAPRRPSARCSRATLRSSTMSWRRITRRCCSRTSSPTPRGTGCASWPRPTFSRWTRASSRRR